MKILSVIPARGGSKGIKFKNIVNLNGKPLIAYTIEESLKSKLINRTIVSTDSQLIANISKKYGADVPFLRPESLALDTSKNIEVLIHAINELSLVGEKYDYVLILQPTQPLRNSYHIDEAIKFLIDSEEDNLVSVSKVKEHPILMRRISEKGTVINLLNCSSTVRRQDFPDYYKVNGAIYINKVNEKLNLNTSLNDNKLAYIMDEKYDIDIDNILDLKLVEIVMKENWI